MLNGSLYMKGTFLSSNYIFMEEYFFLVERDRDQHQLNLFFPFLKQIIPEYACTDEKKGMKVLPCKIT